MLKFLNVMILDVRNAALITTLTDTNMPINYAETV